MKFTRTETSLKVKLTNSFGWFEILLIGALVVASIVSIITADGVSKIAFGILSCLMVALFIWRLLSFKRYDLELLREGSSSLTTINVLGSRKSQQFALSDIIKLQFESGSGYRSVFVEEKLTATFSSGKTVTILHTIRPGIGRDQRYADMFEAISEFIRLPLERFTKYKTL